MQKRRSPATQVKAAARTLIAALPGLPYRVPERSPSSALFPARYLAGDFPRVPR
ncbi:hypothetical protein NNX28_00010 [Arthrobacter sp. zg-Y859]|uniref:Uncharacterized protein n=1 Tax=Arthrobacter jinronghuae TaxID=2964609 RepID=A0ABT1NKR0_9MICC|nr:hypothetical protein [Arthrobacter jinronghuae]MCQ1948313.1 hypothetical protein [Arthrobacter jinronghuae]UWX78845.1 hypothetical protein N2K98_01070 [Arthrobacter jinronghuae]